MKQMNKVYIQEYEKLIGKPIPKMNLDDDVFGYIYDRLRAFLKEAYIKNPQDMLLNKTWWKSVEKTDISLYKKTNNDALLIALQFPIFAIMSIIISRISILGLALYVLSYCVWIISFSCYLNNKRHKRYFRASFKVLCADIIENLTTFECELCGHAETDYNLTLQSINMYKCEHGHIFCKGHISASDKELAMALLKSREQYYIYKYNKDDKDIHVDKVQNVLMAIGYEGYDNYEQIFKDYGLSENYPSKYCPVCNK